MWLAWGRQGIHTDFWMGNLLTNVHWENREEDGGITLSCMLRRGDEVYSVSTNKW